MYKIFAYGSNMDFEQMISRCPSAKFVTTGLVQGHVLVFPRTAKTPGRACADGTPGGVASIRTTENQNDVVEGVIYEINSADLNHLDYLEGLHTNSYVREEISVASRDGALVHCLVYIANPQPNGPFRPSAKYKAHIVNGAREHGLSDQYLCALEKIETCCEALLSAD